MTQIITLLSQKGGPGKSTIARMAAVAFAQAGWDTKLLDADTHQSTSVRWYGRRQASGLSTENLIVSSAGAISRNCSHDLIIVDGAPHATTQTVEFAKQADLILIPTGLAIDDLAPASSLAMALVKHHGVNPERIRFVLNKVGVKQVEVQEAILALEESGVKVMAETLRESLCYRAALDAGKAPQEVIYSIPKRRAVALVTAIADTLEQVA